MATQYTILRVWKETAYKLKVLAAMRKESMIAFLDHLITEEYAKILGAPVERQHHEA